MASYCSRCGREAALQAGFDGGMYCPDCRIQLDPSNMDCRSCAERYCGGVMACAFCARCPPSGYEREFVSDMKKPVPGPIRMDEKCERCGGGMGGRAFILRGKALCRNCLYFEQDRWEIVSAKPGKAGTRIRIVLPGPGKGGPAKPLDEDALGRRIFHSAGLDPEKPPPDPFGGARTLAEKRMPDGSCVNCEAYSAGKKRGNFLGSKIRGDG